jgi:hypothetical protein
MKIIIVDARAVRSIPLESELRAVALDSDLVIEKIAVVQMPGRNGRLDGFPRQLHRQLPFWLLTWLIR